MIKRRMNPIRKLTVIPILYDEVFGSDYIRPTMHRSHNEWGIYRKFIKLRGYFSNFKSPRLTRAILVGSNCGKPLIVQTTCVRRKE
tara:strand:+ start:1356 stop:1613 length:258 start_codon:yes stop_codon:yes gene_type:complete